MSVMLFIFNVIFNVTYRHRAWSTHQTGRGIGTPRYAVVVSALPSYVYYTQQIHHNYLFGTSSSVILRIKEENSGFDSNDFGQIHVFCLLVFCIQPNRISRPDN
jgi:hypothetical protein